MTDDCRHPVDWLSLVNVIVARLRPNPNIGFLQRIAGGIGTTQHPARYRIELAAGDAIELGRGYLVAQHGCAEQLQQELLGLCQHLSIQ